MKKLLNWMTHHRIRLGAYFIVLAPALFTASDNYWNASWYTKWIALMMCLAVIPAWDLGKKLHWSVGLAFFSTVEIALYYFGWRDTRYRTHGLLDILAVNKLAAYSIIPFLLMAYFFTRIKFITYVALGQGFMWLCLVGSAYVIFEAIFMGYVGFEAGGMFGNASMNSCLIAMQYAFVLAYPRFYGGYWKSRGVWRWVGYTLPWVAVLITRRLAPLLVMTAVTATYLWGIAPTRSRKKLLPYGVTALSLVFTAGLFLVDKNQLLDGSGRFEVWSAFLKWFFDPRSTTQVIEWITANPGQPALFNDWAGILFGFGPGSTAVMLPYIQRTQHVQECCGWWMWFHNDYLQLLFEQGVLGVAAYLPLFFYLVKWGSKSPVILSGLVGVGLTAAGNYPMRQMAGSFFAAYLVFYVFTYLKEIHFNEPDQDFDNG